MPIKMDVKRTSISRQSFLWCQFYESVHEAPVMRGGEERMFFSSYMGLCLGLEERGNKKILK